MKKILIFSLFILTCTFNGFSQKEALIPIRGVLSRTFQIKNPANEQIGTSFKVAGSDKKTTYFITAKHLFQGCDFKDGDAIKIQILNDGEWAKSSCIIHFPSNSKVDLCALEIPGQKWEKDYFKIDYKTLEIGQQVYFLGFPLGLETKISKDWNNGYNYPLVKYAYVSSIDIDIDSESFIKNAVENTTENAIEGSIKYGQHTLLLDGMNNPGFSGGPVFAMLNKKLTLVGVISGYFNQKNVIKIGGQSIIVPENSGIILAYSSIYIDQLINKK